MSSITIYENISEFINYVSMQDDYNMHKWIYEKYSEEELKIKDMFVRKDGHSGITKHMYICLVIPE